MNRRVFITASGGLLAAAESAFKALHINSMEEARSVAAERHSERILHIEVGNSRWDPTEDEIREIARLFEDANAVATGDPLGAVVITRDGVVAKVLEPQKGCVTLIRAGNEYWEPTDEEVEELGRLWQDAENDAAGSIVVTRDGVSIEHLNLTEVSDGDLLVLKTAVEEELRRR